MMENVYVIKVRTKPPLSSLYPSERRYSASTVGGLALVHFGLGALSLLLGTLALSLQGPILSIACLVPFVTGLLAWRRWYIDRNITIFFYGSLFSLVAAILCFVATVLDLAAATDATRGSLWSLQHILEPSTTFPQIDINQTTVDDSLLPKNHFNSTENSHPSPNARLETLTPGIVIDKMSNISGYILRGSPALESMEEDSQDYITTMTYDDLKGEASVIYENKAAMSEEESRSNVTKSLEMIKSEVMSFWQKNYEESSRSRTLLTVNVLVASLLEIFWSALSAKIALRGVLNRLPDMNYANNVIPRRKEGTGLSGKKKPPPPRPDILDHDRRLSESLQNLSALHQLRNASPSLPLPESSREFRERVERFLANQAAHRIVEGSCT